MRLKGDEAFAEELSPVLPTYNTVREPAMIRQT